MGWRCRSGRISRDEALGNADSRNDLGLRIRPGACPGNHVPTARVPQRRLFAIVQLTWHPPCSFHDGENTLAVPRARYGTDFPDRLLEEGGEGDDGEDGDLSVQDDR